MAFSSSRTREKTGVKDFGFFDKVLRRQSRLKPSKNVSLTYFLLQFFLFVVAVKNRVYKVTMLLLQRRMLVIVGCASAFLAPIGPPAGFRVLAAKTKSTAITDEAGASH